MQEYLTFRKMITPVAIPVLFWIGALAYVVLGLVMIADGDLGGILTLLLGPLLIRIGSEALLVVFRILDTLVEIRDKLRV